MRFDEGDADDIAPSLFAGKASPKKKPEPELPAAQPITPVAPPTNGHPPAVAVGLPGSDPFGRV